MSFTFRHMAVVEYANTEDATKACKYMDGGQIDGQEVMVTIVKPTRADARFKRRPISPRKHSPARRSRSPARRKKTPPKGSPPRRRGRKSVSSSDSD